jgi:hypothetical protein
MLRINDHPIFASEAMRRRKMLPWWECVAMMASLSLLLWFAIVMIAAVF